MKLKTILTFLAAAAIAVPAMADDTPLGKEMSAMNKALRTLKRQVADPAKKAENLELIAKIKKHTEESTKLEPAKTKEQGDKAAYIAKYKEQMAELSKSFDALEAAIKADKQDEAKAIFEKLSEQKEKGHKDFGADD